MLPVLNSRLVSHQAAAIETIRCLFVLRDGDELPLRTEIIAALCNAFVRLSTKPPPDTQCNDNDSGSATLERPGMIPLCSTTRLESMEFHGLTNFDTDPYDYSNSISKDKFKESKYLKVYARALSESFTREFDGSLTIDFHAKATTSFFNALTLMPHKKWFNTFEKVYAKSSGGC